MIACLFSPVLRRSLSTPARWGELQYSSLGDKRRTACTTPRKPCLETILYVRTYVRTWCLSVRPTMRFTLYDFHALCWRDRRGRTRDDTPPTLKISRMCGRACSRQSQRGLHINTLFVILFVITSETRIDCQKTYPTRCCISQDATALLNGHAWRRLLPSTPSMKNTHCSPLVRSSPPAAGNFRVACGFALSQHLDDGRRTLTLWASNS